MIFSYQGVEFGGDAGRLRVRKFEPGAVEIRTDDTPRPQRDGAIAGRDFLGSATWAFDLAARYQKTLAGSLAASVELETKWKDPAVRLTPNVTVPLSYEMDGRWRRVYGRPGRFAGVVADKYAQMGVGKITADFRVLDPLHYDDAETTVRLTIVPATVGGLVAPLIAPLTSVRSSAPRVGLVNNLGDAGTPLTATFHGPVTDPWVRAAAGWEIGLSGSLAYDVSVTVDARSGTVTRSDGAPVAGMLTRATRLSGSVLPAGPSELTFGGKDMTGTATVDLTWRNAHTSI